MVMIMTTAFPKIIANKFYIMAFPLNIRNLYAGGKTFEKVSYPATFSIISRNALG